MGFVTRFERIYSPNDLPRAWRRLFLLTLPISLPLYLAYLVLHCILLVFFILGGLAFGVVFHVVGGCIFETIGWVRKLWSQP